MLKLADLLENTEQYKPYMYSPTGFSCHVCKFLNYNKDESRWTCSNTDYQKWVGTHYLNDEEGNPIQDPAKWCSNWFKPHTK